MDNQGMPNQNANRSFCGKCGVLIPAESRFCPSCGQPIEPAPAYPIEPPPVYPDQPAVPYQTAQNYPVQQQYPGYPQYVKPPRKTHLALTLGAAFGLIAVASIAVIFFLTTQNRGKDNPKVTIPTTIATTTQATTTSQPTTQDAKTDEQSSIVSKGVNLDDLGNITNGQYFFDDGQNQFYSSFDGNSAAHIYRTLKSSQQTTAIFDGFGWSLVEYKDWLYFSGNQGTVIDGTYNIFRMKLDGSQIEKINTGYCYGMSIFQNHLYYIKKSSSSSADYTICRSGLDGRDEQVLITDFNGYSVIFENMLYYCSKNGTYYRAQLDGTKSIVVLTDSVKMAIIGNGKIIYTDANGNINLADIDGKNPRLIRAAGTMPIWSLNSQKDTIFYTVYDPTMVEGTSAYTYELYRISFDGTGNQMIYNSLSYGTYINIVDDKVYTLDYAIDAANGTMPAITKSMNLTGEGVTDLYR